MTWPSCASVLSTPTGKRPWRSVRRWARAALSGRDKTTIVVGDQIRSFGLWVEQLIAESTGKAGPRLRARADHRARAR